MKKSTLSKMARAGKDIGKKGKNFAKIVAKATPKYGKKVAKKIAGSIFWKLKGKNK